MRGKCPGNKGEEIVFRTSQRLDTEIGSYCSSEVAATTSRYYEDKC